MDKTNLSKNKIIHKKTFGSVSKSRIFRYSQLSKIAMVFWIGGTWTIGIIIIPILFKTIDQVTAAGITKQLLDINAYIGLLATFIALIGIITQFKHLLFKVPRFWYALAMETLLIVNYFAAFPMIARIKQQMSYIAHQVITIQNDSFDFWHSMSAILYILIGILGLLYLLEI